MYIIDHSKLAAKSYKNIEELDSKRIIIRSCLNVTVDPNGTMIDTTRFDESFPLVEELATKAKSLVITAHLGRPKVRSIDTSFKDIAAAFQERFDKSNSGVRVKLVDDLTEANITEIQDNNFQESKTIFLVENIRYFPGEESKDLEERMRFAQVLASLGDVFINDAFADYRESASTYNIAQLLPSYIGPVFLKEVEAISRFSNPEKPFVAILGGAKLSEKLDALNALGKIADKILIGGAMAYTLLKAKGISIGKSLVEDDKLEVAREIIAKYGDKLVLPVDHLIAKEFAIDAQYNLLDSVNIPDDSLAIDIGWESTKNFKREIEGAKSILWNGPMGVFEWDHSGIGTESIGKAIVENTQAFKFAGGGDSIAAINKYHLKPFDHVSTGGGAMLSFLAYDTFPTLEVILG